MTENAEPLAVQDEPTEPKGPELLSEEWVEQTLKKAGVQGEEPEGPAVVTEQGEESPEAPTEVPVVAAPTWREAAIPVSDDTVPQHFRGKAVGDVWNSYRELESTWNKDRQRMRELEAKVAAQETVREMLGTKPEAPQTPTDPYQAAGIDLETDPVLNPTSFYPKQRELILAEAKQLFEKELAQREAATTAQRAEQANVEMVSNALSYVEKERGLSVAETKMRMPSLIMAAADDGSGKPDPQKLQEIVSDPKKLLAIHDSIFGAPAIPASVPISKPVPNPPGAKVPKTVEPTAPVLGPQLKEYEVDILDDLFEAMKNNLSPEVAKGISSDRLRARYAANLKKVRG